MNNYKLPKQFQDIKDSMRCFNETKDHVYQGYASDMLIALVETAQATAEAFYLIQSAEDLGLKLNHYALAGLFDKKRSVSAYSAKL